MFGACLSMSDFFYNDILMATFSYQVGSTTSVATNRAMIVLRWRLKVTTFLLLIIRFISTMCGLCWQKHDEFKHNLLRWRLHVVCVHAMSDSGLRADRYGAYITMMWEGVGRSTNARGRVVVSGSRTWADDWKARTCEAGCGRSGLRRGQEDCGCGWRSQDDHYPFLFLQ